MSRYKRAIAVITLSVITAIAASLGVGVAAMMTNAPTIEVVSFAAGVGAIWGAIAGADIPVSS